MKKTILLLLSLFLIMSLFTGCSEKEGRTQIKQIAIEYLKFKTDKPNVFERFYVVPVINGYKTINGKIEVFSHYPNKKYSSYTEFFQDNKLAQEIISEKYTNYRYAFFIISETELNKGKYDEFIKKLISENADISIKQYSKKIKFKIPVGVGFDMWDTYKEIYRVRATEVVSYMVLSEMNTIIANYNNAYKTNYPIITIRNESPKGILSTMGHILNWDDINNYGDINELKKISKETEKITVGELQHMTNISGFNNVSIAKMNRGAVNIFISFLNEGLPSVPFVDPLPKFPINSTEPIEFYQLINKK